ncbi:MAG: methyltransferase domain-containing protein [Terriglobales bacterium]
MTTAAAIREHYDSLAFIYRTFWGDHIHHGLFLDGDGPARAQVRLLEHCVGLLGAVGREVLDVGCGHGGTAIHLAEECKCRVLGITISEKQAHIARENAARAGVGEQVSIVAADAETFAYPAEQFELVWTMESSEHFADKRAYFANAGRTLRAGGQVLLSAWTGSMTSPRVQEVATRFLCPELWTREQYESAIAAAGLRAQVAEDLSPRVLPTWEICRQRAKAAAVAVKLLPAAVREFVAGIDVILEAYRSGELTYTVIVAEKP